MKPLIGLTCEVEHSDREFARRGASLAFTYTEAIRSTGGIPVILPLTTDPATLREYFDRCSGFLLPGGGDVSAEFYSATMAAERKRLIFGIDPERDQMEIFLVLEALAKGKPILGICRGIQIMNVSTGGTLVVDIPSEVKSPLCHRLPQGDAEHEIKITAPCKLHEILGVSTIRVNSKHHQATESVGEGWQVTARANDGVIEAMEYPTHPFAVGLQCHPERLFRTHPEFSKIFAAFVSATLR